MTTVNIYHKFKIHFLYYIFALLAILTGYFKEFILFSIIILIHEIGHVMMAIKLNWCIDKIIILPFGGVTIFNEKINRPISEEFLIAIAGPIMQTIFYLILTLFKLNDYIYNYHYAILLFNLIPIYPLDGSKILNLLFNKILPYKISHKITTSLSLIFIIILLIYGFIYNCSLVVTIIMFFLFFKVIDEIKKHDYFFNKFLLERYIYKISFNKKKIINNKISKMYRDYTHIFKISNKYYTEREILSKKFDFKDKL